MNKSLFLLLLLPTYAICSEIKPDPVALLKEAESIRNPRMAYVADVLLTEKPNLPNPPKQAVQEKRYKVFIKDTTTTLIRFVHPDPGNAALMIGDGMWLSIKGASTLKIAPENKLAGNAAYGDLARINYDDLYDPHFARLDHHEGKEVYVLDLSLKPSRSSLYEKIEYWLEKASKKPLKAIYKTSDNTVLREAEFTNYKKVLGVERPHMMIFKSPLDQKTVTTIEFQNPRKEPMRDSMFLRNNLK